MSSIGNNPVGREFQLAREANELSIEQVCQLLKIKPQQVLMLESDTYNASALDIYQVGYIQAYCRLLKLDAQIILNKLETKGFMLSKPTQSHKKSVRSYRFIQVLCIIATALTVISYIADMQVAPVEKPSRRIAQPFALNEMEN